jgi:hypothetical protein
MAQIDLNPNATKQFLESLYGSYYSQATRLSYLGVRGRKETDPPGIMSFIRFYLGIAPLLKDMGKWERDCNYWIGAALRKSGKGGKKVDCLALTALYSDVDYGQDGHRKKNTWQTKGEALAAILAFPLPPSILIHSGGGFQPYWLLKEPVGLENGNYAQVEAIMKGLALGLGGDVGTQDISRILRLPGTFNMKLAGKPRPVGIVWCEPTRVYALADFAEYEAPASSSQKQEKRRNSGTSTGPQSIDLNYFNLPGWVKTLILSGAREGYESRSHRDHAVICELCRTGLDLDTIEAIFQGYQIGDKYREKASQGRAYLRASINKVEDPGPTQAPPIIPQWPVLAQEAYYGLAGEFVGMVEPHTEADPVALLGQFLTYFGNVIGPGPYYKVEGDRHHTNLDLTPVGATSKARKGTSHGHVRNVFEQVDPAWAQGRITGGLSSGEGLIWEVRDPISKREPVRQGGRLTGEYQEIEVDAGVNDKRLLVYEPEFSSVLKVMGREGSNLSDVIRKSWDGSDLRTMTKNSPTKATGAHISIIGHITAEELRRYLDKTEMANGFGNRFIWLCVKRSKILPHGGQIHTVNFAPLIQRLTTAVNFARQVGQVSMTPDTAKLWEVVYGPLSEGKPGLTGALLARGEAQAVRLSTIYALLDQSTLIMPDHLQAALSFWDYAEASVRFIFGDALGDPVADLILSALKTATNGLTRTEISNLFGRNKDAGRIAVALNLLQSHNLVRVEHIETGGRKAERWFHVTK